MPLGAEHNEDHPTMGSGRREGRGRWLRPSVSLAVTLAFADASIVVLTLPQIVNALHTSIAHVVWVIVAYNLALIVVAVAVIASGGRLASKRTLIGGLAVFGVGLAGFGCGQRARIPDRDAVRAGRGRRAAAVRVVARVLTVGARGRVGVGRVGGCRRSWRGIGPALGGVLTELFDWRAIFFAQAPVAALAAMAVTASSASSTPLEPGERGLGLDDEVGRLPADRRIHLHPAGANLGLALVSAALIGALFLVTVLMIDVWLLSPLGAAAVISVIPVATVLTERIVRGDAPLRQAGAGAIALAVGLGGLALVSRRELAWVVVDLGLCGVGMGLVFPALTAAALRTPGPQMLSAARTVAARDAGLVLGLLILTPVFVHGLSGASSRAIPPVTRAVVSAPISIVLKLQIGAGLIAANNHASQSQLPDINPTFAQAAQADPSGAPQLTALRDQVQNLIERAATRAFRRPLLYCALFALLAIPPVALGAWYARRHPRET